MYFIDFALTIISGEKRPLVLQKEKSNCRATILKLRTTTMNVCCKHNSPKEQTCMMWSSLVISIASWLFSKAVNTALQALYGQKQETGERIYINRDY